jgi:hypothetical protein
MKALKDETISSTSFLLLNIRIAALTLPITSFPDLRNHRPGNVSFPRDELVFDSSLRLQKEHTRPGGGLKILESKSFTNRASFSPKEFLTQSIAKDRKENLCVLFA